MFQCPSALLTVALYHSLPLLFRGVVFYPPKYQRLEPKSSIFYVVLNLFSTRGLSHACFDPTLLGYVTFLCFFCDIHKFAHLNISKKQNK